MTQKNQSEQLEELSAFMRSADAVVVGAGAGLSTAAGHEYSGERFRKVFADFEEKYGFHNCYSGGFYRFDTLEEYWAFWSRNIMLNRYSGPTELYKELLNALDGTNFFVITTNVDHQFQLAGFPKDRLFYTQGDYGLMQCSKPCHEKTYDNEELVRTMVERQDGMRVPTELVPMCPRCGAPMTNNLRVDETFVRDAGWHAAAAHYQSFLREHEDDRVLYLELGVGYNTPGIIKYDLWRRTFRNPDARYACINKGQAFAPKELEGRAWAIDEDLAKAIPYLQHA